MPETKSQNGSQETAQGGAGGDERRRSEGEDKEMNSREKPRRAVPANWRADG